MITDQDGLVGVFSDQAYNLILLAEDEARMLGQTEVQPEHVLLALARRGNVERLLARRNVTAADIHRLIVSDGGMGSELSVGRLPRSAATDAALEAAVDAAAARGVAPSSEHVLLGLQADPGAVAILRAAGIDDIKRLVDEAYPDGGVPLSPEQIASYRTRIGRSRERPRPGPIPPVFERFTAQARAAVIAAQRGDSNYAEPVDLLRGLLTVEDSVARRVLAQHGITRAAFGVDEPNPSPHQANHGRWAAGSSTPIAPSRRSTSHRTNEQPSPRPPQLGQLYGDDARRLIAQDSLSQAVRHGHERIGTGHLLLAIVETHDQAVSAILGDQDPESIRAAVINALPGDET